MVKIISAAMLMLFAHPLFAQVEIKPDTILLQPLEISAVRATEKTPVAKSDLNNQMIRERNTGADLPFLLNQLPSVTVNSDAGNGIGYTAIRIRGIDASRINVTLNSIPYNDAESQLTYFVDLPDIASSTNSIQVQRGVGTSTNGAGAFGGTVNIGTNENHLGKSVELNNSYGSYSSFKNTLVYHSGLLNKHLLFDARASNISSKGYIERASSRLRSLYLSSAYISGNNSIRLNVINGIEKTYQAWYGVDEDSLSVHRKYNPAGTNKTGEPYPNQTDNYTQTHYQLFFNHYNKNWRWNIAAFITKGKGYYEEYDSSQNYSSYNLPDYNDGTIFLQQTDLVRQLWLDNIFFGNIFSVIYTKGKTNINTGGSWNEYQGKHYGKISYMKNPVVIVPDFRWYNLTADKKDYSIYSKWSQAISRKWTSFVDLQLRNVHYKIDGFKDNPELMINKNYTFFNPKTGITYNNENVTVYLSYSHAVKEPNRDDFEAAEINQPVPEQLDDFETGISKKTKNSFWSFNFYYMQYKDQLILTGKINDVGAYTRTNVAHSYRTGIEIETDLLLSKYVSVLANLSISENRVRNFTEYVDDYDNGGQIAKKYPTSDLAFSPSPVVNTTLSWKPLNKIRLNYYSKYVGRQYLDNTSQKSRSINSYLTHDAQLSYSFIKKKNTIVEGFVQVNNIFSRKYEPSGYTYSYYYDQKLTTKNFYYPMAPVNFMIGLNVKL